MGRPSGETLLIAALLDRLGDTQAQALLERLDNWLSQHDRDTHPGTSGTGRVRTGIGEKVASQTRKDS